MTGQHLGKYVIKSSPDIITDAGPAHEVPVSLYLGVEHLEQGFVSFYTRICFETKYNSDNKSEEQMF